VLFYNFVIEGEAAGVSIVHIMLRNQIEAIIRFASAYPQLKRQYKLWCKLHGNVWTPTGSA